MPLVEFERTLLKALDLIGQRAFPQHSPVDMLEGVEQGGPGPLVWEAGVHEANAWVLCPPPARWRSMVMAGQGHCLHTNGTAVDPATAYAV